MFVVSCTVTGTTKTLENLTDLMTDLYVAKSKAALLGSRLRFEERNLFINVKIIYQRSRHDTFATFVTKEDGLYYCNDIRVLFETIRTTWFIY